jgi:Leucine-rich repeat (LRR) protein
MNNIIEINDDIEHLVQLEELHIPNNKIERVSPFIRKLLSLTNLSLASNRLKEVLPLEELSSLPLQRLTVHNNPKYSHIDKPLVGDEIKSFFIQEKTL